MAPVLRTARCELRPITGADTTELQALFARPGVRRFLWDDRIVSAEQTADVVATSGELFTEHRFGLWALRREGSTAIDGFAGIWPFRDPPEFELLFGVAEPQWGQGYAPEAARAVLEYCGAVLELPMIRASTDAGNTASIKVLEKLGFAAVTRATVGGLDTIFFERGSMPFKSKAKR